MEDFRVLLVEADPLAGESLANTVAQMGWSVIGTASTGEEAVDLAITTLPHLVLMDIQLAGDMDGIDTAREIQFRHTCATIFVSEITHEPTLRRLKSIQRTFYLPKPITPFQLRQIIPQLISLLGYSSFNQETSDPSDPLGDSIFLTHKGQQERIRLHEIRYLKAEHNHCRVYVTRESPIFFMASQPLGGVLEEIKAKIDGQNFIRIHKSYAINLQYLTRRHGNNLILGQDTLIVGKTYRDFVFSVINPS